MSNLDLAAMRRALGELRQCVTALRDRYGDAPSVRRIANDVERLDIDVAEFDATPPPHQPPREPDLVLVSDEPYDPSLWRDADDEGVGGHQRHVR